METKIVSRESLHGTKYGVEAFLDALIRESTGFWGTGKVTYPTSAERFRVAVTDAGMPKLIPALLNNETDAFWGTKDEAAALVNALRISGSPLEPYVHYWA